MRTKCCGYLAVSTRRKVQGGLHFQEHRYLENPSEAQTEGWYWKSNYACKCKHLEI